MHPARTEPAGATADPRSDAELLAASETDSHAFRLLYDRYAERVVAFVQRRIPDADAARDVAAETFCQVWRCRGTFRDDCGGTIGPWLFAIAGNVLAHSARRRKQEFAAAAALGLARISDAVPGPDWTTDLAADLELALAGLPPAQRQAVQLRHLLDLPYDQIAAALGVDEVSARSSVSRGVSRLRSRLRPVPDPTPPARPTDPKETS